MGFLGRKYSSDDGDSGRAFWSVSCKSDSRFDGSGYAYTVISAALSAEDHIQRRIRELGLREDEVPRDIEYGGGK